MSIEVRGAIKRFDGVAAVDDVTAAIEDGAFFVVLGPSGCGKSTLLRLIAGLETLDAGEIRLGGATVAGPHSHVPPEARGVGVVFQSYALWPHMTARDNVAFPIEAAGVGRAAARAAAETHLETVSLRAFADRAPAALSGGQRQRVALARCLAQGAKTILMDEPLANLDPHLREAMEGELADFHRTSGATTLYITHDQREAMALGSKVAVMRSGRFEQVGAPEEVYARPATAHVAGFIGRGALLDATIERVRGGRCVARIGRAQLDMRCAPETKAGPARALLRPENVALASGDLDGASDVLRARVLSATYRGGFREVVLRAASGETLIADTRDPLAVGEDVAARLLDGWVVPG